MNRTGSSASNGTIYGTRRTRRRPPTLVLATAVATLVVTATTAALIASLGPTAPAGSGTASGPAGESGAAPADYQVLTPPVALEPVSAESQLGESQPAESRPGESQPAESQLAESRPGGFPVNEDTRGDGGNDPPAGGPLQPQEPQQPAAPLPPADPCEGTEPAALAVSPASVQLTPGVYEGSFRVHNCGPEPIGWSAGSKPVTLSEGSGTLAGGESIELGFVVDSAAFPAGPYRLTIDVSWQHQSTSVEVHGSALAVAQAPRPDPTPDSLVGNTGPAGCAASCITKAWLTPSPSGTQTSLEVRTHTAARILAVVGTDADGITAASGAAYRTQWTTTLEPLTPGTTYPIRVSATDADGNESTETGTFTMPQRPTGLSAGEPGGCSMSCVETALLTPRPGSTSQQLAVSTLVPTTMAVYVDDRKPQPNDAGEPHFPLKAPMTSTGDSFRTEWAANLKGFAHAKRYHVILKVTDEQSRSQIHTGSFKTPPEPVGNHQNRVLITFYKIDVTADGDNGTGNKRGELRFTFATGDRHHPELDTGERKVRSPKTLSLDDGDRAPGRAVLVENAPDQLWIRVQGLERDRERREVHEAVNSQPPPPWPSAPPLEDRVSGESPDRSKDWNTAIGLIDLHQLPNPDDALPECYGYGEGAHGDICAILVADGKHAPRFQVYISVQVLD